MDLTPELREKFLRFHQAYEFARVKLEASGASGHTIARTVWEEALREEFLSLDELKLYKKLVAMHSVNGGELFALPSVPDEPVPIDDHTE
jgi:hypothetical protein